MPGRRGFDYYGDTDPDETPGKRRLREEREAARADLKARMAAARGETPAPSAPLVPAPVAPRLGVAVRELTPEVAKRIADQARQGLPPETAAARMRIPRPLLYAWLAAGRADVEAGAETLAAELVLALEHGRADHEAAQLAAIDACTQDKNLNHAAAAWILERAHPETWGKAPVEVNVQVGVVLPGLTSLPRERLEALAGKAPARRVIEGK